MNNFEVLLDVAARLGVRVVWGQWDHALGKGGYDHKSRSIALRKDLHPMLATCTLAHELGHAVHEHTHTMCASWNARQEREADEWAANMLISPKAYRQAESVVGPHTGAIAAELGVTVHLVDVWRARQRRLQRGN